MVVRVTPGLDVLARINGGCGDGWSVTIVTNIKFKQN